MCDQMNVAINETINERINETTNLMIVDDYESRLREKILELSVSKTFAKIKLETDILDQSTDPPELKNKKKQYLLGVSSWGFKLQKDLEDMKSGKPYDDISDVAKKVVEMELDVLLKYTSSFSEIIVNLQRKIDDANRIIRSA